MKIFVNNNWIKYDINFLLENPYRYKDQLIGNKVFIGFKCLCGAQIQKKYKCKDLLSNKLEFKCRTCLTKNTNLKKYGVENPSQNKDIQEKIKRTNLKKYGKASPLQSKSIKEKIKQTNLKKYGVKYPMQSNKIQAKLRENNQKKYGVDYIFQDEKIKNKIAETNKEKYGVPNPFASKVIQKKIKQTNLKKYGTIFVTQLESVKQKSRKTNIDKFGFDHPLKNENIKQKLRDSIYKNTFESIQKRYNHVEFLFEKINYQGGQNDIQYQFQCKKCRTIFNDSIDNGRAPRCPKCFPKIIGSSHFEQEIIEWLKLFHVKIEKNKRNIISPYELDIYLSDYNLAIEFNGLYWHSELQGRNKNYHLNKTIECNKKDIQLIHIFEDEWVEKADIVKSIIKSKIGVYDKIIYARQCEIKEIKNNDFYDQNHIQGNIKSKINLGLFYKNELVGMMSFSKPRFNKKYNWEITRFANKLNTLVIGGFGKLFSYFKKKYNGSIITYADKRYFNGRVYLKNGFQQLKDSKPNYYYTNYKHRYSRLQFQKHKIKNADINLTEWHNMQLQGWDRIWDCGNNVYVL